MTVLLTGANGFVGSHILDRLVRGGREVAILVRTTSDTRFIAEHMGRVDVRYGSLGDAESLRRAFRGVRAVIHCAAKTKAVRTREFYAVNAEGTRNVVQACNASADTVERLVLLSSLAATGPGTQERPAREDAEPQPVSHYGRSKLLAERHVREESRVPYVILRPAAVYGPRDRDFLLAFRAVRSGVVPLIAGGRQPLSLVYAADVAEAVCRSVGRIRATGKVYHVAHAVPWTQRAFLAQIARTMGRRPWRLGVPVAALYPVCLVRDVWSRLTSRPSIMNLQKIPEYRARGWVCSVERSARDLDFVASTSLHEGLALTVDWYTRNGWL